MPETPRKNSDTSALLAHLSASYAIAVPIGIAIALEAYAELHSIRPETAIVEAVRSYVGDR